MSQYTAVLTSQTYRAMVNSSGARQLGVREIGSPMPAVGDDTLALAQSLMLNIPGFDWTIEIDILGRHRVTVHFKGADIEVG